MSTIIEAHNVSKQYRLGESIAQGENFREFLVRKIKRPFERLKDLNPAERNRDTQYLWALRDVSFNVQEGDVVGIIGRNGAGKSTLLKILSRITDPTEGYIKMYGRLVSLLEVGTGFHPELTGRENIFLNGAILGMRRAEILSKFDEIVAFSEIERFLDTPVKRYSSGMYVRLAFSVAAHLNPEILVVDEVLAVGDMAFQKKCLGKMDEVSRGGRTVLFVSHNMAAVEHLCKRGMVLNQGRMVFNGTAKEAVNYYLHRVAGEDNDVSSHVVDLRKASGRSSKSRPLLQELEFYTEGDRPLNAGLRIGAPLKIKVHFNLENPTESFNVGLGFNSLYGQRVFTAHSLFEPARNHGEVVGPQVFVCEIPSLTLLTGEYLMRIWLDIGHTEADLIDNAARISIVDADYYGTGKVPWNGVFVLEHHWYLEQAPATEESLTMEATSGASPSSRSV
jgi:lipopolysaccharide transport system ATP-binding protein